MRRGLALALAGGSVLLAAPNAPAQEAEVVSYQAIAAADGVRSEIVVQGAPLSSTVFDGGAPVAQARVNALGVADAMASMPYPGENPTTLPSLVFPLIGLPAPPPYPLLASSSHPVRPSQEVSTGPVHLLAASEEGSARSEGASSGGGSDGSDAAIGRAGASAAAAVEEETGAIVAEATSRTESVLVAGVLRVGTVAAGATARRPPTGGIVVESSLAATGVSIAGVTVGVTEEGIVLPGTTAPVPDTSGLSPVLDSAGVSFQLVEATESDDGIVSAGLVVTVALPGSPMAHTYTFGRTRAHVVASFRDAPATAAPEPASPASGAVAPATGPPSPAASPSPARPVSPPSVAPSAAPAVAQPASAPGPSSLVDAVSFGSFYLVIVLGAALALAGSVLIRVFGVRLAWTS